MDRAARVILRNVIELADEVRTIAARLLGVDGVVEEPPN